MVGWGVLAKTLIISGYKTFIPFAGGLFSFPLVFGATYAMGKAAEYYFNQKRKGVPIDREHFKQLWEMASKEGKEKGEQEQKKGASKADKELEKYE